MGNIDFEFANPKTARVYIVTLRADEPSPFPALSDEAEVKKSKPNLPANAGAAQLSDRNTAGADKRQCQEAAKEKDSAEAAALNPRRARSEKPPSSASTLMAAAANRGHSHRSRQLPRALPPPKD